VGDLLGLQLLLNLHQRFLHAFAVVSLALFVYKGRASWTTNCSINLV
jgi:hypothetical protein